MDIYIKFESDKFILKVNKYESIKSIINKYLELKNINDSIENYFLDYNGNYLDNDFSLDKYKIKDNNILNLNKKIKGGTLVNRIIIIIFGIIIGLIPIFILPMGFIPLTASLIKIIVEKSLNTVFKYLVCTLGKITLYSRAKLLLIFLKYTAFALMIYVLITFPLVLFCISLKGQTVLDNPQSLCAPMNAGKTSGLILTIIFFIIYGCFKFGDYFLKFFINIFNMNYYSSIMFNPTLTSLLKGYNRLKYKPFLILPFIGEGIIAYFKGLGLLVKVSDLVLSSVQKLGCKLKFNNGDFLKDVLSRVKSFKTSKKISHTTSSQTSNDDDSLSSNKKIDFGLNDIICQPDIDQCCSPSNYEFIGNALSIFLDNELTSSFLKSNKIYSIFGLIVQSIYGAALDRLGYDTGLYGSLSEQKIYLNRILDEDINKLSDKTKDLINTFLIDGDQSIIPNIKEGLDTNLNIPLNEKKINEVNKLKEKIDNIDEKMIYYSKEEKTAYIVGSNFFKSIFKIIFVNIFCNVVSTAKSSENVINQMGQITEITDMLKAGSSTGLILCVLYIITIIILVICTLFNIL
jgi:hypothetical protein